MSTVCCFLWLFSLNVSIFAFKWNFYCLEPPQGISFVPTTFRDTLTLTCGTIGGSKPPATINLFYKKNGKRMERIDVVEVRKFYLEINYLKTWLLINIIIKF